MYTDLKFLSEWRWAKMWAKPICNKLKIKETISIQASWNVTCMAYSCMDWLSFEEMWSDVKAAKEALLKVLSLLSCAVFCVRLSCQCLVFSFICVHLNSEQYAEFICWPAQVSEDQLKWARRWKSPGLPRSHVSGKVLVLVKGNWKTLPNMKGLLVPCWSWGWQRWEIQRARSYDTWLP